ncbi:hypothetical protein ABW19_dt0208742 [Dactylella cylindrospora]|nr:hypothetical protein ABW19_dt0208742 [Dactylella cylindrospora]
MSSSSKKPVAPNYNKNSPGIRRILREAQEITRSPCRDFVAAPLEHNLHEWHFTLRGPPAPSPYDGGFYHGRILLPPNYPMRPPMFRFYTDSGRFEVNRDVCLSNSGFHEETWQPSWGIRLALTALRAHMDTEPEGQVGGIDCPENIRRELAKKSIDYRCPECGGGGEEEGMKIPEEGGSSEQQVEIPAELRFGYKDQLKPNEGAAGNQPVSGTPNVSGISGSVGEAAAPRPAPPVPFSPTELNLQPTPTVRVDDQEPAMLIPFASGHQQAINRQVTHRGVGVNGAPPGIPAPGVTAAVPAPAARAFADPNQSNQDRVIGYLDIAILFLGVFLALLVVGKVY